MNISADTALILARLRPPFARSAYVLFRATGEGLVNSGITFETVINEPAIAPGAGIVSKVYSALPDWQTSDAQLKQSTVRHVVIDHGNGVTTTVGGLATLTVNQGQEVNRGDKLGDLFTNQLFFAVALNRRPFNPCTINEYWLIQNSNVVTGQGGKIRFAPDRILRDLTRGFATLWADGLNYFVDLFNAPTLLVNVAFNGDGSKVGPGATSMTDTDYWNVYTPADFLATASSTCYYYYYGGSGTLAYYTFSTSAVVELKDYTETRSPIFLERVAPLFSAAGSGASWDNMLKLWVGGYLGPVPYENTFKLRNMPAGNYVLYLYSNQGPTTFYAAVNQDLPVAKANSPTGTTAFIENANYVSYSLTVPASGSIVFKAVGYLSGLQLERV